MILADASIWIDHFRTPNSRLLDIMAARELLIHPFVIGELALGSLRNRGAVLRDLRKLKPASGVSDEEVAVLIEGERLYNRGIGYVDACLVASALLTEECRFWTRDRRLRSVAEDLGVAAPMTH